MSFDDRLLRRMAGISKSPGERVAQRRQRREQKLQRESERRIKLVEQIMQREQGVPGFRMMPFANMHKK